MNRVLVGGEARPDALAAGRRSFGALGLGAGREQAVCDLGGRALHRGVAVDCGDSGHLLLVGLLALAAPHDPLGRLWLDHRYALAVDRADEDLARRGLNVGRGAGGVEGVEVDRGVAHDLLGRALGHRRAGHLAHEADRLVKRPADNGPHQPLLALVAVDPCRQPQLGVERMDRLLPGGAVADARDANRAKERDDGAAVKPLAAQPQRRVAVTDDDRAADVAVAAGVDVRLQRETHQLAAAAR